MVTGRRADPEEPDARGGFSSSVTAAHGLPPRPHQVAHRGVTEYRAKQASYNTCFLARKLPDVVNAVMQAGVWQEHIGAMRLTPTVATPAAAGEATDRRWWWPWQGSSALPPGPRGLKVGIVRPSLIGACWREPMPGSSPPRSLQAPNPAFPIPAPPVGGWVDSQTGPSPLFLAGGLGLLTWCPGRPRVVADIVPADVVAARVIAAGAHLAMGTPSSGSRSPHNPAAGLRRTRLRVCGATPVEKRWDRGKRGVWSAPWAPSGTSPPAGVRSHPVGLGLVKLGTRCSVPRLGRHPHEAEPAPTREETHGNGWSWWRRRGGTIRAPAVAPCNLHLVLGPCAKAAPHPRIVSERHTLAPTFRDAAPSPVWPARKPPRCAPPATPLFNSPNLGMAWRSRRRPGPDSHVQAPSPPAVASRVAPGPRRLHRGRWTARPGCLLRVGRRARPHGQTATPTRLSEPPVNGEGQRIMDTWQRHTTLACLYEDRHCRKPGVACFGRTWTSSGVRLTPAYSPVPQPRPSPGGRSTCDSWGPAALCAQREPAEADDRIDLITEKREYEVSPPRPRESLRPDTGMARPGRSAHPARFCVYAP